MWPEDAQCVEEKGQVAHFQAWVASHQEAKFVITLSWVCQEYGVFRHLQHMQTEEIM